MSNRYYSNRLRKIEKKKLKVRRRKSRPKSFKTEEAARKWAESNKIKKYVLKDLKTGDKKKIIVVAD